MAQLRGLIIRQLGAGHKSMNNLRYIFPGVLLQASQAHPTTGTQYGGLSWQTEANLPFGVTAPRQAFQPEHFSQILFCLLGDPH